MILVVLVLILTTSQFVNARVCQFVSSLRHTSFSSVSQSVAVNLSNKGFGRRLCFERGIFGRDLVWAFVVIEAEPE